MKKRLLCLGLVAALCQLVATGCCWRPVAHWRANHPCRPCTPAFSAPVHHPLLHPILTRRALVHGEGGRVGHGGPIGLPECHGCPTGVPVGFHGHPGDVVPITGVPIIGTPQPITPGPKVVPSYELPHPMPVPKSSGGY